MTTDRAVADLRRRQLAVIALARDYVTAGVPLRTVRDALGISAAVWAARVADLRLYEDEQE